MGEVQEGQGSQAQLTIQATSADNSWYQSQPTSADGSADPFSAILAQGVLFAAFACLLLMIPLQAALQPAFAPPPRFHAVSA